MVTRGNVNTARITRYRSYEVAIGEGGGGGGGVMGVERLPQCDDQLIFFFSFHTDASSSVQKAVTHRHPE